MVKYAVLVISVMLLAGSATSQSAEKVTVESPTEGRITHEFVGEQQMKDHLLQMLADFTPYMRDNWLEISDKNSAGAPLGVFRGGNTMGNNEQGVRHNADFSMICAFLVKYAQGKVTLPEGITWDNLNNWAARSLNYAYSTHKANRLYACKNNSYWGSTAKNDSQWESSLWAMSVAYSAFFQWDTLTADQKKAIEKMLEAECNYELERDIPTGYKGDTKAEENGWEADVLAVALGLFPDNAKAPQWFERMREFAINSYSHPDDASDNTVIDPEYDNKTVADLYRGQNLFDDWTLQNHSLFHTSYQNVVMQELGEIGGERPDAQQSECDGPGAEPPGFGRRRTGHAQRQRLEPVSVRPDHVIFHHGLFPAGSGGVVPGEHGVQIHPGASDDHGRRLVAASCRRRLAPNGRGGAPRHDDMADARGDAYGFRHSGHMAGNSG